MKTTAAACLLCLLLLAGCGQMGPLYRPVPEAPDSGQAREE
jgi:predicted small lipoprotein YifL